MANFKFLQQYMNLQKDVMYDVIEDIGFATIGYCKNDKSPFWNLALIERPINKTQQLEIENKLIGLERKPALYFEEQEDMSVFATECGYSKSNGDCWLFYESGKVDLKNFEMVKKVEIDQDLEIFIKTFNDCYQKEDPQNPYGELGEYLDVARNAWHKHRDTNRLEYFTVYKNKIPVAVSTLNNFQGIGYISNVGSLRSVRGEGFGKLATLYCIAESKRKGSTVQCLTTEEGHYPHEFYKRIGFRHKFTALLFVKDEANKAQE